MSASNGGVGASAGLRGAVISYHRPCVGGGYCGGVVRALALMYHRSCPLSMGQVGVRHPVGCSVYQLADEHRPWPLRTCQSEVIDACTIGPTSAAWLVNPRSWVAWMAKRADIGVKAVAVHDDACIETESNNRK